MSQLNSTDFENKYNDASTGLFKDNTSQARTPLQDRTLVTDLVQSFYNKESDKIERTEKIITKSSHGWVVGNIITIDGTGVYVKMSNPSAEVFIGLVTEVIDVNNVKVCTEGFATGLSGLTAGSMYYATASGTLSTTPSGVAVLKALTSAAGYIVKNVIDGGTL